MSWRELSPEQLGKLKSPLVIDVRSPCEHEKERIPNSINVALLSDEERATVGTIYAHEGEVIARREALRIISPKIPYIVDCILELRRPQQSVVVHCWRGGLRSEAVASFLSVVGIDCWRLTGGFKAWRSCLLDDFKRDPYQFEAVVLHGHTGAGKTELLQELSSLGCSVLDLEKLANHRGSVFGALGLDEQPTQKNFEADLWVEVRQLRGTVFLEAEGRKIGKLAVPDFLRKRIDAGRSVLVTASVEVRAKRIVDEYLAHMDNELLNRARNSLRLLKPSLGGKCIETIKAMADEGRFYEVVKILLQEYYDPLYEKQMARYQPFDTTVDGEDIGKAARQLCQNGVSIRVSERGTIC